MIDDRGSATRIKLLGGAFYIAQAIGRRTDRGNVGIMLPTSNAFPATLLGTWIAGKVAVSLNYLLSKDDLHHVIRDSDIDLIVTVGPMLDFIGGEDALPDGVTLLKLDEQKFTGMPELRWPPIYKRDDLALLLYTSGTSGKPKGVMLTHGNLLANVTQGIEHAGITHANAMLGVLPQFHAFGVTVLTLIPLYCGAKVVYTARFIPKKILQLIREHQPDIFVAVPSMYGALLSLKDQTPEDWTSVRMPISGAEPLPDPIYERFLDELNCEILEGYGLTETAPCTHWATPTAKKRHSVGRALPRVRTLIAGEDGQWLGPDQDGEIVLAGPNLMAGYYKLPQLTAEVLREVPDPADPDKTLRVFHTGDIGHVDEDGFLFITGRKKEMLIIGGENVFPREIEEVLTRHRTVRAAAIIGRPDPMRGEVPVAYVELEEDVDFDEPALRAFCREHLPQYKVPRDIIRIDQLPRNPTGKILRRQLVEREA
jgi:long-chain acyl-CoA synthetase